MSTYITLHQYL